MQPLEDLLTNTVATKTWVDNGGTGTMSPMIVGNRALLVLSQTQEVHKEIESTLEMLRKAGGLKTAEQHATEPSTDGNLPAPARQGPRLRLSGPTAQGMGGMGMGSMGGGMGGMGGGMVGRGGGQTPWVISTIPVVGPGAAQGGDADLLGGLKTSNAANQKAKVLHLKQRQEAGQSGGMGGGMGGGMF